MSKILNANCYKFKKDHVIYESGNAVKGKSIFLVNKGKVLIKYQLKNNKSFEIIIPNGGIFGAIESLADEDYRLTEAKFVEDSEICMWNKEDFLIAVSMMPELGLKSVVFLSTFLRTLNQKIQDLG